MTVRRATAGDEAIVRSLRLQALADAPDAFDSTVEREVARTDADWQRWFTDGATFVLEHAGEPKGLAAGVPHDREPSIAFLMSMWVHPELRGTGGAEALVASATAWARAEGFDEMWLHVGRCNDRARRFYEKVGFRAVGEVVRERDGLVEIEMHRGLGGEREG